MTPTQLESGGAAVGITSDFDGDLRPGPSGSVNGGATAPDLGADEFDGVPQDLNPPSISYTPLSLTCLTTARTLSATITDDSGVPTSGIRLPVLYWRVNAGAWSAATATHMGGPNYDFTFGAGVVVSDVVSYYIVAQDNAGTPNVGANPSAGAAGFTANPPAAATPPTTPSSYSIGGSLSGSFNVGTAQVYTTLTAAIAAYNTSCLTGPVTFLLTDAAYTEAAAMTINANADASATNTLTIKPTLANTTIAVTGGSATAILTLNGADFVTIDGSIGSTVNSCCPLSAATRDLTITNTNTGTSSAVVWVQTTAGANAATNNQVINCNLVGSGVTQTLFGVGSGSATISTSSLGTSNNNNSFINNNISGVQYGIYSQGASLATKNTGTIINQNIISTSANTKGGIWVGFEDAPTISCNSVSNIAQTSSPDVFGITLGMGTSVSATTSAGNEVTNATVTNNTIGSVVNSGTFSAVGIAVASAASGTTLIANNMISGVAANGTSGDFSAGIILGGGTGSITNVYNNTVSMQGTISGGSAATQTSACLAVTNSTEPVLDLRNNIFTNTQLGNSGATLRFAAIALGYSTFTTLTSNNNDLFCAGAGPGTYQIGITGTVVAGTNRTTLLNWQTATSQDAQSINVLPTFMSSTDLHMNMGLTSTQLESGGAVVGVANDIDCQTRPGPTGSVNGGATAPDMGADEFDGVPAVPMTYVSSTVTQVAGGAFAGVINQEIIRIQVVTAGLLSPLSLTSLDLNANGTSVITDIDATTAKVYYTGASTTFSTGTLFGATTPTIATFTVAGTQTLASGNNYFWLAYDVIPGATPGNFIDGECTSITVGSPQAPSTPAPAGNKVIVGPMAGNYNVGTAMTFPNFATLTNAVANLNARGVSAAVTLTLMDATYNAGSGETFPLNINTIAGASGVNTITIRPNTGVAAAISGASATSGIFKLNGADYVTINGLNTGGSSLSIANTSATITSCVIWIASASLTDGATNNVIRNCSLTGASNTTTVAGIIAGSGTTLGDAAQWPNSNNTIAGNTIKTAQNGLYLRGEATTFDDSWVVSKNVIGSTVGAEKMTFRGILIGNALNMAVDSNTIIGVVSTASSSSTTTGIQVAFATSGGSVTRNSIRDIKQINTTGWGSNGIFLAQTSTTANLAVANNFISDVASDGFNDDTASDNGYGIMVNTGGGYNIYNNTIAMNTEQVKTTGITAAINIAEAVATTSSLNIRNNIFSTTQTVGTNYSIYNASLGGNAIFTNINYNDYVSTEHIGFLTTSRTTLGDWQTATAQDANSVSIAPVFTSATDLHLPDGSNGSLFDLGTPIAGITKDIDNQDRSATAPDMGADEFSPITLNLTAFIEGYYVGGSPPLRDVLGLSGVPGSNSTQCDTITVQLRNSTTPFAVAASFMGVLNRDGILACKFPSDKQGGTYFVALQHRNALETWSGGGDGLSATSFSAVTTNYNFTTSANQAYGGNMKGMGGGGTAPFAIYSGDIDSDGEVLPADYNLWLISNTNGDIGYYPTDLDGDGEVLPADYAIWLVNNNLGVLISIP
ncbi:MAG: hypothetical protein IPL63_05180 [Saprospiraceae bacterium]|nr:hypothetical protein [Saprospiraceae bacterium]